MNLAIFGTKTLIILDILKTLEYFCRTLLFRPFLMFGRTCVKTCYLACTVITFCFSRIQRNLSIIQGSAHAYSEPYVSLVYSKPWHVPITKHIQTPRYIHNTILSIFTKAACWVFDTVLSAPSRVIGYL